MARKTPQMVAKKWAAGMQQATQSMTDGVNSVTVSPTEKAAAAVDKWEAGVRRARTEGTYESGLRSVSLAQWQDAMRTKGIPRITDGVRAAQPKMERFLGELLPYTDSVKEQIAQMPSTTPQDRIARMLRNVELMSQFRSSRRR